MTLPVEAYREPLHRETTAIAERYRDAAEFVPLLYMDRDNPTDLDWALVRATNVHMVPGETSPRLRKIDFPHPEIPAPMDLESEVVAGCVEHLMRKQPNVSDSDVDSITQAVMEICASVDNEPQSITTLFKTIGVLSMYVTASGEPLVRGYISTAFSLDMSARISPDRVASVESRVDIEDVRGNIAVASLAMLLQPHQLTHPRIQAALFT
jgi:hypothetical protein